MLGFGLGLGLGLGLVRVRVRVKVRVRVRVTVTGLSPVTVSCSRHAGHVPSRAVPVKTKGEPSEVYCWPLSVTSTGAACGAARRGALQSSALALSTWLGLGIGLGLEIGLGLGLGLGLRLGLG